MESTMMLYWAQKLSFFYDFLPDEELSSSTKNGRNQQSLQKDYFNELNFYQSTVKSYLQYLEYSL
jgi:hypothetical protein